MTLAYVAGLAASVEAFGATAGIGQIGAVYLGASLVAAASPPGRPRRMEVATSRPDRHRLHARPRHRLATYWLPVPPGWYSWRLPQRMGYV